MNILDGRLLRWCEHLGLVQKLKANELMQSKYHELHGLEDYIIKLIREAREKGMNWVWEPTDVYQPDDVTYWSLPSVDVAGVFGAQNNNYLPKAFKKLKFVLKGLDWDTESSAWYPKFETKEQALEAIGKFNILLDKVILKKK